MLKEIIHHDLYTHLALFYPSTCVIKYYTVENRDSYGQPSPAWIDYPDHIGIDCVIAPSGGREVKLADMTIAVSTHTIVLTGYYPTLTPKMRAVIPGFVPPWAGGGYYDILLVEIDSHNKSTRLTVQAVQV